MPVSSLLLTVLGISIYLWVRDPVDGCYSSISTFMTGFMMQEEFNCIHGMFVCMTGPSHVIYIHTHGQRQRRLLRVELDREAQLKPDGLVAQYTTL